MKKAITRAFFSLALAVVFCSNSEAQSGFTSIFNGKDLTGWEGDPKYWSVEDGALTGVTDGTLKANSFIIWRGGTVEIMANIH